MAWGQHDLHNHVYIYIYVTQLHLYGLPKFGMQLLGSRAQQGAYSHQPHVTTVELYKAETDRQTDRQADRHTRHQTRPEQTKADQTRPEQTRPEQSRPEQSRPDQSSIIPFFQNIIEYPSSFRIPLELASLAPDWPVQVTSSTGC